MLTVDREPAAQETSLQGIGLFEDMSLEQVERLLIQRAMTRFDGNVSKAARTLGLSRSALYRRLQKYQL